MSHIPLLIFLKKSKEVEQETLKEVRERKKLLQQVRQDVFHEMFYQLLTRA
jgi:hypothetical protein